jgi:hypothetical protein
MLKDRENCTVSSIVRLSRYLRSLGYFLCYQYRSCPLALEAAMGLLELGQSATEVTSLMTVCLPSIGNVEW